jgi:hypothetical protein|tara:strand:+ start:185 stop:670 length:486 start_codon:yes stop_codon:yes gene_type:complete
MSSATETNSKKKEKAKSLFPYGIEHREVIGYSTKDGKRYPLYSVKRILPKKRTSNKFFFKVITILLLLCVAILTYGCSSTPIVDSRGKSSANVDGTAERYHDDYYTCKSLVEDNTNGFVDKSKVLYNGLRWRVLWLSPKLDTRQDLINNCLEGRGYNVINK